MLKGWTLTDLCCDQCNATPLMREPAGIASAANRPRIQFCALCDGSPTGRATSSANPDTTASSSSTLPQTEPTSKSTEKETDPSESISTLLLQGYSLLGDNCTNPSCRGIPLVGYPRKKDGSKDGRRMCVACGGRWVDGNDLGGMKLMPDTSAGSVTAGGGGESPRSRARREMYGLSAQGTDIKGKQVDKSHTSAAPVAIQEGEDDDFELDTVDVPTPAAQQVSIPTGRPRNRN